MVEKHILLADTHAETLEELRQAVGPGWQLTQVSSGNAALEALKHHPYQVLFISLYLPDIQTAQLLNRVRSKFPQTVRFVVAAEHDRDRVVKEALGAHQLLIRPFNADEVKATLERAIGSEVWASHDSLHKLVARMRTLPTVPAVYTEILAALKSPDTTVETVGGLIAKDMAITTKILQVINSAYFGLPRTVTNPEEAVGLLGFETVKSMVMAIKLLNQYDRLKTGTFSIERLWEHSTAVAQSARRIVLLQTGDRETAEDAYAAGLLHDVGKAILAGNFAEQYAGVESLARKQQILTWEVEKEIFGASHGEVGAHLLGLWGLPMDVLEATALHHEPARTQNKTFSALTAVHVANVLQYAAHAHLEGEVAPKIDMEYLAEIGMIQSLPGWCREILGVEGASDSIMGDQAKPASSVPHAALAAIPPPGSAVSNHAGLAQAASLSAQPRSEFSSQGTADESLIEAAAEIAAENEQSTEVCEPQEALAGQTELEEPPSVSEPESTETPAPLFDNGRRARERSGWLLPAGVALVAVVVGWLAFGRQTRSSQDPVVVKAHPLDTVVEPAASANQAREQAQSEAAPLDDARSSTNQAQPAPAADSPPTARASMPPQNTSVAATEPAAPAEPRFPALKLQGILFSPKRPAAIINGVMVHNNDLLLGARIVEIRPTSITVQFHNQRQILSLE